MWRNRDRFKSARAIRVVRVESMRLSQNQQAPIASRPFLTLKRVEEARHGRADDRLIVRPRRGRNALVPDLAEAGVRPADQMKRIGFRRRGSGKGGHGKHGCGAEQGNAAHENGSIGKGCDACPQANSGGRRARRDGRPVMKLSIGGARGGSRKIRQCDCGISPAALRQSNQVVVW